MLPHDGSTLTAIACEGLSAASGTADTQPGVWNDNDMPVAGPSSASQSTTTFEWFELADTSTVTSPSDREQSLEAPPLAGPSRLSQSLPHIHSAWPIDNQYGTAWPSFDASSGRSAGCGSQSDGSMGRTFPSSETIDHRMGEGVWANERLSLPGRHYDDADASSAELGNQFGLDVQSDNTMITPEQSQGSLPRFAQPAGSSRAAPSGMMQKAKAQMTTKARSKKAKKAQADPNMEMPAALLLPIPFPRVLFKDTERGRQCAAKGLTKDSTAPFTCFICEEYCKPTGQNGEYEAFATWKQFQSHISRCAPRESMLPRCPFCDHPEPAYGRPHQMERHLVGYGGNAACKALAKLVASGTKTNRALADWLEEHGKPIIPKFLGMRLARIFHYAKYQDLEMHDEPDLTPQHREDEAA